MFAIVRDVEGRGGRHKCFSNFYAKFPPRPAACRNRRMQHICLWSLVYGASFRIRIQIQIRIRICTEAEAEAGSSRNMQLQLVCGSSKIVFA